MPRNSLIKKFTILLVVGVLATACGGEREAPSPPRDVLHPSPADFGDPPLPPGGARTDPGRNPMPQPEYRSDVARDRACGAFTAISQLAVETASPKVAADGLTAKPDGQALIRLANALQSLDRRNLATSLQTAVSAHATTLTSLGTLINHNAAVEAIDSMKAVSLATGDTVKTLCN